MKRLIVLAALILMPALATAQSSSVFGRDTEHGGYGGLVTKVTSVNDEVGVLTGFEGVWIIDHTAFLGISGASLVNKVDAKKLQPGGTPFVLRLNEFGLRGGYIHNSDDLVHLTAGATVGGGSMTLSERYVWTDENDFAWDTEQMYLLIEPEIGAEVNITSWMRAHVGASYRFVTGADYEGMKSGDLSGPAGSFSLRFGSF